MIDMGMKYCPKCGTALSEDAKFCTSCGAKLEDYKPTEPVHKPNAGMSDPAPRSSDLCTVGLIFLILGTILRGFLILPLAWCLPITLTVRSRMRSGRPIGVGLKVCALIFVSLIGGIALLADTDSN